MIRLLLAVILLFLAGLSVYLRQGGLVPDDFRESRLTDQQLVADADWLWLSDDEQMQLAGYWLAHKDYEKAEYWARRALAQNPTNGGVVGILIDVQFNRLRADQAYLLIDLGRLLWPEIYGRMKK